MPTQRQEVYRCSKCGNIVEVLHAADGQLICCAQPMDLQEENTTDAAQEKHVPVIEKVDGGVKVTVGSVAHPMADDHYIEWIEVIADGRVCQKFLQPGDAPEAVFCCEAEELTARAYCNLHGHWKA
jgi:superoxide reductase